MKQLSVLLSLLFQLTTLQAQLSDNFNDGDLINNPGWNGDVTNFIVNANLQLQLNAPDAGSSTLSTAYEIPDSCIWEFYLKLDFAPSNANLLRVYLQSSNSDLLSGQGYYIEIGETGSNDAIKFYRQDGLANSTLLGMLSAGAVASQPALARMKIIRTGSGDWTFSVDYTGGNNPVTELLVTDDIYESGQAYFGFYCLYTATRKDKFYFDDVLCYSLVKDTKAPVFLSFDIVDEQNIDLIFDEKLNKSIVENPDNYLIQPGIGTPSNVQLDAVNQNIIHLEFSTPFVSPNSYKLSVLNITDVAANVLGSFDINFNYIAASPPDVNDLVINEILADPTPEVGLPPYEFLELYNNSSKQLSLNGLKLSDGSSTSTLPGFVLGPAEYLILCNKSDTNSFKIFGKTLGISSFPSLNNSGDIITLSDQNGKFINTAYYNDSFYANAIKKEGGWSLELINPSNLCLGDENWAASVSPIGGTPGQKNSVFNNTPDLTAPLITEVIASDLNTVEVKFNEKISADAALKISLFKISPDIIIGQSSISSDQKSLTINMSTELISGITYTLELAPGFTDCAGNATTKTQSIQFSLPGAPEIHDIVINEILFNPRSGGYDFIELYNRSGKIFNLSDFSIANASNDIKQINDAKLFYPGQYIVLTESPDNIKNEYFVKDSNLLYLVDLPSFNDDNGEVSIVYHKSIPGKIIDSFSYDESFHYTLLNNKEGVSLERINPEVFLSGTTNWHSASSTAGFATPTYKNSQFSLNIQPESGSFTLSSDKISPDEDGFKDLVLINYKLESPGFTVNIDIYDSSGRKIKQLANNELAGSEGSFKWDGTTDESTKARLGIYIIFIEYFNLQGTVIQQKLPLVVAGKMN